MALRKNRNDAISSSQKVLNLTSQAANIAAAEGAKRAHRKVFNEDVTMTIQQDRSMQYESLPESPPYQMTEQPSSATIGMGSEKAL